MSAAGRGAAPTRMGLLRARRRLERVRKGADLLRRKREALVRELFRLAQPAVAARGAIAEAAEAAWHALLEGLAARGGADLETLGRPARELEVALRPGQVWGLAVPEVAARAPVRRTLGARGASPALSGPAEAGVADAFEALVDLLLEAAPHEMRIRRLGDALARTSRQLNTLDRLVAPALAADIAAIRRALDEREREEHLRLRRLARRRG